MMGAIKRHRIAVIVPGGIGTGADNLGVPVLERQIRLLAKDFDITVFSLFPVNRDFRPENFKIVSITSRNAIVKSTALWSAFRKLHRQDKFHAIHGFWALPSGFLAVLLGKYFHVKSVVSVLGGDAIALPQIQYGLMRNTLTRKLILWTLRHASHTTALTAFLSDNLGQYGLKRKPEIVPWGIDTKLFAYKKRSITTPIRFLHVGNLSPVKDQATLLKAFRLVQSQIPSQLTIIGEGILEAEVRRLIKELDVEDHVAIVPPMRYESLPAYYSNADVLLHTSLSEGQSEVVTEAMSCGLLVCGTKVGLMYDLPECCLSVAVGDHQALGDSIVKLVKDQKQMEAIVQRAHAWTTEHDIHWTVFQTKSIYLS
jgi:glycosyltransferase involved in cell wall biosynthesis